VRGHRHGAGGRGPRRRIGAIVAGTLALIVVAGAVTISIARSAGDPDCGGATVRLAVAPEAAPLIERAAADLGEECPVAAITRLVAGQTSATITEAGLDGWVPATSAWLSLGSTVPSGDAPPPATPDTGGSAPAPSPDPTPAGSAPVSLVRTPLVVAAPHPLTETLGWPDRQPTWAELTAAVVQGRIPRFSMDSPVRTPIGLLAMLSVHTAMSRTTPDRGIAQMRALTLRSRLADAEAEWTGSLRQLATVTDPDFAIQEVGAFPVTEQALRSYQNGQPAIALAPLYPADGLMEADYPLALTPAAAADPGRREAATRLIARIHSAEFAATVAAHGFRPASVAPESVREGAVPQRATPDENGLLERYPTPAAVPTDPRLVTAQAHQWAGYQQLAFQALILVDASASMNEPVRDSNGDRTTKADLLREAGIQAAELFGLDTSLGIWMFATPAPASPPYVEVVPFGPLDEPVDGVARREVVRTVSESYRPFDRAGTPLYETVLRGVAAMQPLVTAEAVTLVVVLTDGRDEDTAYAMPRPEFLSRLGDARDPDRPMPVFCIGYGADADMAALTDIAEATGGRAVASNDPGDLASAIAQVFLAAHGSR
jgi:Ca-activated chloride channel family protein